MFSPLFGYRPGYEVLASSNSYLIVLSEDAIRDSFGRINSPMTYRVFPRTHGESTETHSPVYPQITFTLRLSSSSSLPVNSPALLKTLVVVPAGGDRESMYSSRGNNAYGQQQQQQPYSAQSAYAQNLGADGASQLSMAARHSAMLGGPQEADISGYRGHPSAGAHYGGQYSSVYGSTALSSAQQVPPASTKGAGPSALEGRSGYGSSMTDSPKFTSGDYVSSASHGYGQKGDQMFSEKLSDYKSLDRRQYVERTGPYGRDLQSDPTGRFADSIAFGHQPDLYDRIDQASVLRQEHILKAQALQSASLDGGPRQADYLAARGANIRHQAQDLISYGGRMDADPHSLSILGGSSHGGQHAPSILGAAPRRDVDDLAYAHTSSNPGYGVSLPPGRDYASGKGLHGTSLESDFPGGTLARGGYPRIDDRKDDRVGYAWELERREEERRRELLREREKDREREKERERKRERERERERKRERERILERQEKERDREHKREPEVRRERTPPRISRDRGGSSSTKAGRSLRRESPRLEASYRRHSPVKEKRREYACKVYSSSLVDIERDYLSMDKRYPRLFVSPECSKVVINWPRENLKIPFRTPVSFEHDFVEEETATEHKMASTTVVTDSPAKPERASTRWNAKIILMSGLSQNALEELSSERSYDDRIPHFCNMLRFAILKKENVFMAIGGPWDSIDGADPSVDNSSLVQTALRYANGVTQLDLKNCRHWNPFLEIHYDRLGKDGLFSHKEITVLYIPDLSECLPSVDAWRDQWLAHKKSIAERERLHTLKKEKSREKEGVKDREPESKKDLKKDDKSEKKKDIESAGKALNVNKKEKDGVKLKEGDGNDVKVEKKDVVEGVEEGNDSGKKNQGEIAAVQPAGSGKKKIIRRVVKQKAAAKKNDVENAAKQNDKLDVGENNSNAEVAGQEDDSSINSTAVKTFTRKKVTKKVAAVKAAKKEDEGDQGVQPDVKSTKELESTEDKPKGNSDPSSEALVQDAPAKTTVKRKIIKRVAKRKVVAKDANEVVASTKIGNEVKKKVTLEEKEEKAIGEQATDADNQGSEAKSKNKTVPKTKSKAAPTGKQENVGSSNETGNKGKNEFGKEEKRTNEKSVSGSKMEIDNDKQKYSQTDGQTDKREKSKEREKPKDGKERKDKDGKAEPRSREAKEKKKHEEPPRHPGLFLQMKGSKDSKLRSLSLSLDSLLDYTDKDIEESTFELSLFAETLYEMLQYQMGSRLLTFLQKLRIKFVAKRNQRKRQREESSAKESEKASSSKRVKTDNPTVEIKTAKTETPDEVSPDGEKAIVKEENTSIDKVADVKPEDESDEDEDPEEDPEEDEDMAEASVKDESENDENVKEEKSGTDVKSENVAEKEKDAQEENAMETSETEPKLEGEEGKGEKGKAKVETKKKETPVTVDKELLQAFRFFDRNRVGYIRVEDMRLIIHNLGKFMSHRDVKELVQSALLESNTGRDDRILYDKLVRMSDRVLREG